MSEQLLFDDADFTEEDKKHKRKEWWKTYSLENREKINAMARASRLKNIDKVTERHKKYYRENRERLLALNAKWKKEHPGYAAQISRNWRVSHPVESKKIAREKRLRNPDASREVATRWRRRHKAKALVNAARERNKAKRLPFDLHDHVDEIQKRIDAGHCELTGIPLKPAATAAHNYNAVSIDRVVPQLGYVYSNIRIVAFAVNCMMGNWGEAVALDIFRKWERKRSEEKKTCEAT